MTIDYDRLGIDLMRRGFTFRRAENHVDRLRLLGNDRETLRKMLNALLHLIDESLTWRDRWEEAGSWVDRLVRV